MFKINYRFTGNYPEHIADIDEMTVRYDLFLGSLSLETETNTLSMAWDWIPLLDFALCLHDICNQLNKQTTGEETFEFTESDATLTFHRYTDQCTLSASFSDVSLSMNYAEFQHEVQLFCKKVINDILHTHQHLKDNSVFRKVIKPVC